MHTVSETLIINDAGMYTQYWLINLPLGNYDVALQKKVCLQIRLFMYAVFDQKHSNIVKY